MTRVLLAEDDLVSSRLVQAQLQAAGYDVMVARSGDEALRLALAPDAPRLLLLDWMMPGLHGPEVIRRLRRLQPDRYRYAILLTQRAGGADLLSGFESGADDYVRKPCDPRELVARLRVGARIIELEDRLRASNMALARLADSDPLTGLPNRRHLLTELESASARCAEQQRPLGVAMVDIDHFKQVNDHHGHAVGDRVLCAVAERMRGRLRDDCTLGRFGGEEFLLVAPNADADAITAIGERLRAAIAEHPIAAGSATVSATISVGVACREPGVEISDAELVRSADAALYDAKRAGRNRVCQAWQESEADGPPALTAH
ncbi:MAG: diguanylate cyclase [Deltaproteobacteria bacterium]|nr:MAG: diguanylate cyclase [Deltaproteobacteria bacterium]